MRRYFIILFCLLSSRNYAQHPDTGYYKLIYNEILNHQDGGTIYYADKPQKEVFKRLLKQMPDALNVLKERGLILTNHEVDTLLRQLKLISKKLQPIDLFPMSKRISSDSIIQIVENKVKEKLDSIRIMNKKEARPINAYRLPWAFFFTNPIYLRSRTICFFYLMYYRNNSGEDGLSVYKAQDDKWIRIATIGGGAW